MDAGHPAPGTAETGSGIPQPNNLMLRVVSALVLAPLTIAVAFIGGWAFVIFWGLAAIGVAYEWNRMIAERRDTAGIVVAGAVLAGAALTAYLSGVVFAGALIILGALVVAALADGQRRGWAAAGILYAGVVLLAPTALRQDGGLGFVALVFLFAVVWATDIFGYFAGRLIGGPKLWRQVSPKKTWAGAIGGAVGAVLSGSAVALAAGLANPLAVPVLALLLSAVSQAGDLLELAVKRRFGVKDASHVIPGHGGIMDRLDGFLAAALVAAIVGVLRGGFAAPARGLLVW